MMRPAVPSRAIFGPDLLPSPQYAYDRPDAKGLDKTVMLCFIPVGFLEAFRVHQYSPYTTAIYVDFEVVSPLRAIGLFAG